MTKILATISAVIALVASVAVASDAPLTQDQAARFVGSLPALEAMSDELEAKGKNDALWIQARPKAGEPFKPYSNAVITLKASHPGEYAQLEQIAESHGFTATQWGGVGDRVMVAYLALKMKEEDPRAVEMMEGMDRSMIERMPPEMRADMEGVFAMMETIKNAPEADHNAVASVKADLDAYMEASGKS